SGGPVLVLKIALVLVALRAAADLPFHVGPRPCLALPEETLVGERLELLADQQLGLRIDARDGGGRVMAGRWVRLRRFRGRTACSGCDCSRCGLLGRPLGRRYGLRRDAPLRLLPQFLDRAFARG